MKNLKIYTKNIEPEAVEQIELLLEQKSFHNSKVRIMPDVHVGKGCVIGFTADLGEKVIPNIVGVDIGCGMLTVQLGKEVLDLEAIDRIINENVPSGREIHEHKKAAFEKVKDLICYRELKDQRKFERGIGTLGGGNHFIEIAVDEEGLNYLVIHTGSRNMGKQVADYYQKLAIELCSGKEEMYAKKDQIIKEYKEQGRRSEIQKSIEILVKEYKNHTPDLPNDLCYLTGKYRDMYLHDMKICQEYASENRKTIAGIILSKYASLQGKSFSWEETEYFETIHNYISFEDNIVRKGAISAKKGEVVLIPINMRDGSIIAIGKGNDEWNQSAPHGAGRLMSRTKAKERFNLAEFKQSMKNVYSTSVVEETIDEAPFVYKPMREIIDNISDTVEIVKIITPIYNFKAKY